MVLLHPYLVLTVAFQIAGAGMRKSLSFSGKEQSWSFLPFPSPLCVFPQGFSGFPLGALEQFFGSSSAALLYRQTLLERLCNT